VTTPYDDEIDDLLRDYQDQRARLGDLQRCINGVAVTVTASRQVVRVTVGAQGQLLSVEFPTGAYRRLTPAELAEVLMTTVGQARDEAIAEVASMVAGGLPEGLDAEELLRGKADLTGILPEDPRMPDTVRAYVETGRPAQAEDGRDE
jgi:hypothetical protein